MNDEYDAATGVEIRRLNCFVLDGSETFSSSLTSDGVVFFLTGLSPHAVQGDKWGQSVSFLSSHFVSALTFEDSPHAYLSNFGKQVIFYCGSASGIDSVDKFKSFLADQYVSGTPVTVVYQLAEPQVIQHEPVVLGKYMPESILDSLGWMVQRVVSVIGMVTISPLLLLGLAMWAVGGAIALFRRLV